MAQLWDLHGTTEFYTCEGLFIFRELLDWCIVAGTMKIMGFRFNFRRNINGDPVY